MPILRASHTDGITQVEFEIMTACRDVRVWHAGFCIIGCIVPIMFPRTILVLFLGHVRAGISTLMCNSRVSQASK